MVDLENALSHCNKGELEDMFRNGERFMSLEVICPEVEQTIPYGNSMLVFHGWKEYDLNGKEIAEDKISAYLRILRVYQMYLEQYYHLTSMNEL